MFSSLRRPLGRNQETRFSMLSKSWARPALCLLSTLLCLASGTHAQTEGYVGEIRMFGGNFAPRGWALCDGQLLAISQNDALFSILGTTYGGDGVNTFALPDLRGRIAVGPRTGPGLPTYRLGQKFGAEKVSLTLNQLPGHGHHATMALQGTDAEGDTDDPEGALMAKVEEPIYHTGAGDVNLNAATVSSGASNTGATGASNQFQKMPPELYVNYIIALVGIYPSRN